MPGGSIHFTDDEINKLLQDVHSGKIHLFNLPTNVYNRVAEELTSTVYEAFNLDPDVSLLTPDLETPRQFKRNLYVFSAAKTFKQIEAMQAFIFNEKGFKRSFQEFEDAAKMVFDVYNKNWLAAEFETATRQAEAGEEWDRLQREADIFPLLKYNTLRDGSVRDEHRSLDGVVRPQNDPFWDRFLPPNGWRCRCFVEQLEEDEEPITPVEKVGPKIFRKTKQGFNQEITQPTKLFDFNPAKEGVIFRDDAQGKGLAHPYFKVAERWEVHKRNNYGLPLPLDVKDLKPLPTLGKQKVKVTTAKPTTLKTTPVEPTKPKIQAHPNKPENYNKVVGENVEMPKGFWSLLKEPLKEFRASVGNEGSYHHFNKVVVDMNRYKTITGRQLITAHEVGHAIHHQNKWVTITDRHPIFEKVFTKWEKELGKGVRGAKRFEIREATQKKLSLETKEKLRKKFKLDNELHKEYWGKLNDTIGALTRGNQGWGHTKAYYNRFGGEGARVEFFAHASENAFVGNPYFKELYPDMYNETIQMIKDLTKTLKE